MSQAITRLYASAVNATSAVKQLEFEGFSADAVALITPGTPIDAAVAVLLSKWVLKAKAKIQAAEIQRGLWLVAVLAPFGMGGRAEEALDRYSPVPSSAADPSEPMRPWDDAAPVSSALGIPVLCNGAAPDTSLGIPTLTSPRMSLSASLGLPLLSKPSQARLAPGLAKFFVSSSIGLPLLTRSRR